MGDAGDLFGASQLGTPILPRPSATYSSESQYTQYIPQQPHARSCTECCRRKVRCDRHYPCANCVKSRSECIFPKSRRRPVRQKKAGGSRDEELLKSLRRLQHRLHSREVSGLMSEGSAGPNDELAETREDTAIKDEPAQLVLDRDRSRYISNSFWASLSRDIEEMRDILDGSSDSESDEDRPDQEKDSPSSRLSQTSRGQFIFGPTSPSTDLEALYPSSSELLAIFDVFQENVDPVVRIFHCPTLRATIAEALPLLERQSPLDRHTEVVLFSVSYAALTSLNEADCQRLFGEEHRVMLPRYRHAVEQSLARARFLDSQNLAVLASLVLYLICVRRHDSSRFVSSLLGVAIRNAQAMGLHRDGTNFQLSPYETEMRRRIWWHICVLDIRASEDHGCDPSIYHQNYDTRFPLNVNDEDISPQDTVSPPERTVGSSMIFCLLRFEVSVALRKLNYPAPIGSGVPHLTSSQKREMVEAIEKRFHDQYIRHCDITKSFDWVSATWARLMLAKMWLATCNPLQYQVGSEGGDAVTEALPSDLWSLAFEKSVEVLELSDLLETGHRAARWRWLFLTHIQWHAVVCVLANLCVRPTDNLSTRAWLVVEGVCERWPSDKGAKKGMLWKPIRRLLDRARQIRATTNNTWSRYGAEESQIQMEPAANTHGVLAGSNTHESTYQNVDSLAASHANTFLSLLTPSAGQHHAADQESLHTAAHLADSTPVVHSTFDQPLADAGSHDQGSSLNPQTLQSDWTNILHELQMGFQEGEELMNPADALQEYGRNFWNSL